MTTDWPVTTLGAVARIIAGQSPPSASYNDRGEGLPFYQGKKQFGDRAIEAPTTWTTQAKKIATEGDILMSVRAPVGPVNLAVEECCIGRGLAAIRPGPEIDRDFLYLALLAQQDRIAGRDGAVFPSLNSKQVAAIEIPFPTRTEQQALVSKVEAALADVRAASDAVRGAYENLRKLETRHADDVFSNLRADTAQVQLGAVADFRNGLNFSKDSRGETVRIVGVKDFAQNFAVPLNNLDTVQVDGELRDADLLQSGDIVFVRSNGNQELIGRSLLVDQLGSEDRVGHSGFTIRARLLSDDLDPVYVCHFVRSASARREMVSAGIGANIKSLSQGTLARLTIPAPDRSKQSAIVRNLEELGSEVSRLADLYRRKLNALSDLRRSLLDQAMRGGLGL